MGNFQGKEMNKQDPDIVGGADSSANLHMPLSKKNNGHGAFPFTGDVNDMAQVRNGPNASRSADPTPQVQGLQSDMSQQDFHNQHTPRTAQVLWDQYKQQYQPQQQYQ